MAIKVQHFFEPETATFSYVVADLTSGGCAVIDAVLEFDYRSGRVRRKLADEIIKFIKDNAYQVQWLLETHIHADHLSGAPYIKSQTGGAIGIGRNITDVQSIFKEIFMVEDGFVPDGRQFDHLFHDQEVFTIGNVSARTIHTPGHTPACVAYQIEDAVFAGDTIFMPDVGTARCDFPGGDAHTLYKSINKLLSLPPETRIYVCHDYPPPGRQPLCLTSVREQREKNIHVHDGITEGEFVEMRTKRDATLSMPTLMIPSIQINMQAGNMPPMEKNGVRYIRVPLDVF